MAEITGGQLNFEMTVDPDELKKALTDAEGKLMGFSDVAELAGEKLDNALKGTAVSYLKELATEAAKTGSTLKSVGDVKIDFGLTKENLAIQKQVIAEIKKNIEEIEKRAKDMAPGMAQASVLGELKPLKEELAAEEKALASLEVEMKKTAVSATTLSSKYLEAKNRLAELTLANKQGTPEYVKAEAEVRKYGTALSDTNARAKALTAGAIGGLAQGLSLITGTMATGTALLGAFGGKSEELNQIMLKTQALLAATVTLQEIKNTTVQKGGVISGIMAVQEMARSRATTLATANTIRATIAQRALNLVANANPYVLLATAILTVVGALSLYVIATNKAEAETKKLIDLNKKIADSVAEPLVAYRNLQGQWNALGNDLKAKEKFIKDNKDEFTKLGVAVDNVNDAENVLRKNSQAFVQAMMLRAKSAALAQIAIENMKRSLELESEYKRKNIDKNLTVGEIAMRTLTDGPGGVASRARAKADAEEVRKSKQKDVELAAKQLKVEKELEALNSKSGFKTPTTEKEKKVKKEKITKEKKADEYFPPGSVAEIQKRMSAIDEALSKATNSGSIEALKNKRIAIAEELAEAIKRIEIKSLEDRANEQEKYNIAYGVIAEQYGKEEADKMYGPLMEGTKSFYEWLMRQRTQLEEKQKKGLLSEKDKTDLVFFISKINELEGKKNAFQNFTDGIDKSLSKIPTLSGQLEFLNNKKEERKTENQKSYDDSEQKYLEEQQDALLKKQKDNYQQMLRDQETFQERSIALQKEFDSVKNSDSYKNGSDADRAKINAAFSQKATDLFFQEMAKSEEWVKVFTDMNLVATTKLEEFKKILQQKLSEAKTIEEKIKIGEFIKKIDETIRQRNPYRDLARAVKSFGDESLTAEEKLDLLRKGISAANGYLNIMENIISDVESGINLLGGSTDNAMGDILNGIKDTVAGIKEAMQGFEDLKEAQKSYLDAKEAGDTFGQVMSGLGMVGAAVKIVGAAIKSVSGWLSGDKKKEREIQRHAKEVEALERAYNDLSRAINNALGDKFFDASRQGIENLRQQKNAINEMIRQEESKKKKNRDDDKIAEWKQKLKDIDNSIADIGQSMSDKILNGLNAKGLADQLADALTSAFQTGEDSAEAMGKTVDKVLADMVKNALKMKLLEGPMQSVVDKMLANMGYDLNGNGAFDGLTDQERQDIKNMITAAGQNYANALQEYEGLFGSQDGIAQGLRGDIKAVTEKTAGALESQINAIRTYQVEGVNIYKENQSYLIQSLQKLVMIEANTRNLIQIRQDISEMNGKMKKGLAGL